MHRWCVSDRSSRRDGIAEEPEPSPSLLRKKTSLSGKALVSRTERGPRQRCMRLSRKFSPSIAGEMAQPTLQSQELDVAEAEEAEACDVVEP